MFGLLISSLDTVYKWDGDRPFPVFAHYNKGCLSFHFFWALLHSFFPPFRRQMDTSFLKPFHRFISTPRTSWWQLQSRCAGLTTFTSTNWRPIPCMPLSAWVSRLLILWSTCRNWARHLYLMELCSSLRYNTKTVVFRCEEWVKLLEIFCF